jgi:hypothetical protein
MAEGAVIAEPGTVEAAIAAVHARWQHAALDHRDVLERVAVRFDGACEAWSAVEHQGAVRLFRKTPSGHVSRYVHRLDEVDGAIDDLAGRDR